MFFIIISAWSNLLWFLLPVENHCAFFSGLEMLQPINFSSKLVKFDLSILGLRP